MSEENTGATGQGTAAGATQGGTPQPEQGQTGSEEAFDKDRAIETIRRQRESEAESKRQLTEFKQRATAAEQELEKLRGSTQTEQERAIREARREGAQELLGKVRVALAKVALKAAGITNARLLQTMARDDAFLKVKITDEGEIEGLDEAVAEFKEATKDLLEKPAPTPGGTWGATGGDTSSSREVTPGMDRLRRAYETSKS